MQEHGMSAVDMKREHKTYKSVGKRQKDKRQKEKRQKQVKRLRCIYCDSSEAVG